ncbi:hypothetical protein SCHPADRAFT_898312 [Schizopora paradoxa]|uniref:t-SNARE coiled-coil homology domain-containing protein n=1 Tax=Schizopora paradoxa TaxID=27342 RepID=A0A0H2SEX6_9AGAM|nr:hypothetical protein SCHPADRAFT_898312 [Schizopora paradoxa]
MSWFKKKDKPLIPPVEEKKDDYARRPAYRREDSTSSAQSRPPYGDRAASGGEGVTGGYGRYGGSRGEDDGYSEARNNLFAGAKKVEPGQGGRSRFAGFNSGQDLEDDDDVETIKTKTKSVNSDTLQISRDALRTVKDTTIIAEETRRKLIDQTEALAGMERSLDVSKGHNSRAEDHVHDINQFNKSIFNPAVTWNKTKKREAQEEKMRLRHEDELADRERNRLLLRDASRRAGEIDAYDDRQDDGEGLSGGYGYGRRNLTQTQMDQRKAERKKYQVGDAGASDDELEDELENNLDEISQMTMRLKSIATMQGEELRSQMPLIERLEEKTVNEEARISRNTRRLDRIK